MSAATDNQFKRKRLYGSMYTLIIYLLLTSHILQNSDFDKDEGACDVAVIMFKVRVTYQSTRTAEQYVHYSLLATTLVSTVHDMMLI